MTRGSDKAQGLTQSRRNEDIQDCAGGVGSRILATVRPGGISAVGGYATRLTRPRGVARVSSPSSLPDVQSRQISVGGRGWTGRRIIPNTALLAAQHGSLTASDSSLGGEPCSFRCLSLVEGIGVPFPRSQGQHRPRDGREIRCGYPGSPDADVPPG